MEKKQLPKREKTKIKPLNAFEKNDENPFLAQAVTQVKENIVKKFKTSTNTGESAVLKAYDEKTGEVLAHTSFVRTIEVDEEKFAKIYLSNFSAFFDLKPSAVRVFDYLLGELIPNKDFFYVSISKALKHTKYKNKSSIYEGLASLCSNEIIARGENEFHYFINPMVLFNGNRLTFAKSYVKRQKPSVIGNPNQLTLDQAIENAEIKEGFENKNP